MAVGSVAQELGQAGEAFQAERTERAKSGRHGLLRGSSHPYPVAVLSSFYSDKSQRFIGDVKYSGILQALKSLMVEFRNHQTLQIIKHVAPHHAAPPPCLCFSRKVKHLRRTGIINPFSNEDVNFRSAGMLWDRNGL